MLNTIYICHIHVDKCLLLKIVLCYFVNARYYWRIYVFVWNIDLCPYLQCYWCITVLLIDVWQFSLIRTVSTPWCLSVKTVVEIKHGKAPYQHGFIVKILISTDWRYTSQISPVRRQKTDKTQVGPVIDHLLDACRPVLLSLAWKPLKLNTVKTGLKIVIRALNRKHVSTV